MLHNPSTLEIASARPAAAADAPLLQQLDLVAILAMIRRHAKVIVTWLVIGLALAVIYAVVAQPQYTSQATLLIGNRQLRSVQDLSAQASPAAEAALVDSEAEALRSERVLLATIKALNLTADPDFNGDADPAFERAIRTATRWANPLNWISTPSPESDPNYRLQRFVIARLSNAIKVARVGRSNVLQIIVTVPRAQRAADIANGIADAYLAEQLASRYEAAKRASTWFQKRVDELREQSGAAQLAAEKFRAENNLVASNGQLVADQQLQQLTKDLATASSERISKQARYDSLSTIIKRGIGDDFVTEALGNSIITNLRQRFSDVSKRHSENLARLGPNHEQVINLRRQMQEFERLIFEELRRIESTYRNELEVAVDKERSTAASLEAAKTQTNSNNSALVVLRQLEQEATSLKASYQNSLQRYQETIQQESFPINDARIISDAARPLLPSEPRKPLVVAVGIILGLGIGVGIAALRELSDRAFRLPQQVEDELGLPVLGSLPNLAPTAVAKEPARRGRFLGAIPGFRKKKADPDPEAERLPDVGDITKYALAHPFSSYAEALRSVKVVLDGRFNSNECKILGIVSTLPGEGKSVVAKNFASLTARQGGRVLLIDADLRRAGLSRVSTPFARRGLTEVLAGQADVSDVLVVEEASGLHILPATVRSDVFNSSELVASVAMANLLKRLAGQYDYIIVDLPPLGPVADARASARLIDAFLLVVEWGGVPSRAVRDALKKSSNVADKLIGAVLNKVELEKMRLYEPYGLDKAQTKLYDQYYK